MRFIVLGLQRARARCNGTPVQAATASVIGLRHEWSAKAMMNVLINKRPRAFSLNARPENSCNGQTVRAYGGLIH